MKGLVMELAYFILCSSPLGAWVTDADFHTAVTNAFSDREVLISPAFTNSLAAFVSNPSSPMALREARLVSIVSRLSANEDDCDGQIFQNCLSQLSNLVVDVINIPSDDWCGPCACVLLTTGADSGGMWSFGFNQTTNYLNRLDGGNFNPNTNSIVWKAVRSFYKTQDMTMRQSLMFSAGCAARKLGYGSATNYFSQLPEPWKSW